MTAQLSEHSTSHPMAGDENGAGNSNDSGGGTDGSSAVSERVVMISFKMEDDDEDMSAAGTSAGLQDDIGLVEQLSQTPPSPFSDVNSGKTHLLFVPYVSKYRIVLLL